ncbi:hypothetical protein [Candidatus Williamhamiltonella defendens]|uniref:hypothetical protein n=1 Tax=Candidatus Williamhamiltonella defendens TaxID=138072 RepID=UPI00130EFBC6|nr:hypothetical protein [Candidatus Hamiltonella defensa]
MAQIQGPKKALELNEQRDKFKRKEELSEIIRNFTENEKIYLNTINHSCSENAVTFLAYILGIKMTFVGKISYPNNDFEPDLMSSFLPKKAIYSFKAKIIFNSIKIILWNA